jgi:hypothetical protein
MNRRVVDIAWAAGFIEGEGSFIGYIAAGKHLRTQITAVQVQKEPLERLHKLFGGTLWFHAKKPTNERQNPAWRWQLGGKEARRLMHVLYPFMSPKRQEQIDKVINLWRMRIEKNTWDLRLVG